MSDSESIMDRMRGKEVNPILLVPVAVIIALVLLYILWLRPKMIADEALRNFNTPEAQAKRDPDQRKISPDYAEAMRKVKEKYGKPGFVRAGSSHMAGVEKPGQ